MYTSTIKSIVYVINSFYIYFTLTSYLKCDNLVLKTR